MKQKVRVIRTMIEGNPYLSQKKIAYTLSLHHDIVKRLIPEELNLRRVNFEWVPHTLTSSQNLERVKISRKPFEQLNKLQVNARARVIAANETWIDFEDPRSAMWIGVDIRRSTRPRQLTSAKKVLFWAYFTPIGIVDIVMLPPGETFDQFFFVDIVSDSFKKKVAQIPDPNSAKGPFTFG
jgi:hypothetical protein